MKRTLTIIGIVIGALLLLIVITVVVALSQLEPNDFNGGNIPTTQVIVALTPIAQGSEFVEGSVGLRSWPADQVPPGVIVNEAELLGKIAKTDIVDGQLIMRSLLRDQIDLVDPSMVYAWCDVENSATLVYSFFSDVGPIEEATIVLGSSGVVRLQAAGEENQAKISCNRNGFGQVVVNFVDSNATAKDMILYSCTLPLECQDGAVTVTTYSPTETK